MFNNRTFPLYVSHTYKICWFPITKCASSSFRWMFKQHDIVNDLSKGRDWGWFLYDKKYLNYFNFTIIRNPYSRLVSCWVDKVLQSDRWIKKGRQSDIIHHMIDNNFTFEQFIKHVCNDTSFRDAHWWSYNQFIPKQFEEFGTVVKCETLEEDFNHLKKKIGLNECTLITRNITNHDHYTTYYTDELIELVSRKFRHDLLRFNYSFGN